MNTVIVIPARLESTRLPNKVLLDLHGKSIIHRVYNQCIKVRNVSSVFIATDNDKIIEHCQLFTDNIIRTNKKHVTGTDRISEAITKINCDNVINVQADEPFIAVSLIEELSKQIDEKDVQMASAMHRIKLFDDLLDPNNVKVCVDNEMNALYFSRGIIPYYRNDKEQLLPRSNHIPNQLHYFKHIGIYGFKKCFLLKYSKMKPSPAENIEKLEQLRVLENGFKIRMIETKSPTLGIDTLEDYQLAQKIINEQQ